jgi:hypothetical protein
MVIGRVPGGPSLKLETRPLYQIKHSFRRGGTAAHTKGSTEIMRKENKVKPLHGFLV